MTERPANWTDTYTIMDVWGGKCTYYADGTYMGYSGGGVSRIDVVRLVLNEGDSPEKRDEFRRALRGPGSPTRPGERAAV